MVLNGLNILDWVIISGLPKCSWSCVFWVRASLLGCHQHCGYGSGSPLVPLVDQVFCVPVQSNPPRRWAGLWHDGMGSPICRGRGVNQKGNRPLAVRYRSTVCWAFWNPSLSGYWHSVLPVSLVRSVILGDKQGVGWGSEPANLYI